MTCEPYLAWLMNRMSPRSIRLALLAVVVVYGGACTRSSGPPRKVCYPAKGELLVKDKPAEGALVILQPRENANRDEWAMGFPRGHVGADGKFEIGTYEDRDGAPAGDYIVLVSWDAPNTQNEEASGPDRLGGRYSDPATSKLTARIEARPTELPPIRLP